MSLCWVRGQLRKPLLWDTTKLTESNWDLKIARPLEVWFALAVSVGRLRSEHIAHNPLHARSYIMWFHVLHACHSFSQSINFESMLMAEWYWQKEINYDLVVLCALPRGNKHEVPPHPLKVSSHNYVLHLQIGYKWVSFGMITREMHIWPPVRGPHLASPAAIKKHLIW